jgi:hypothetical protein
VVAISPWAITFTTCPHSGQAVTAKRKQEQAEYLGHREPRHRDLRLHRQRPLLVSLSTPDEQHVADREVRAADELPGALDADQEADNDERADQL